MSPLFVVVVVIAAAGLFFGLNWLSARTSREITIPFAGGDLPASEVTAAFERMGCVVSCPTGDEITAHTPSDALSFGQIMTVKLENGALRVRSSFSDSQAWRGSKNQENVERFKKEWERRAEFTAAAFDPAVRATAEASALKNARKTLWGGVFAVAVGVGFLLLLLVPARGAAGKGANLRILAFALIPLAYGLPRIWAAWSRLRK
jgi:hypothetical protein